MFRASPHETLDRDMRCLHHPQLSMAGKESDSSAKQERHDAGDLKPAQVTKQPLTRDTVFGERSINSITTFNTKPESLLKVCQSNKAVIISDNSKFFTFVFSLL